MKGQDPATQREIEEVVRRFLEDQLPLEEAAREIARRLPSDAWSLSWTKDTPAKDAARLKKLYWRTSRLWEEMLDEDSH